MTLLKPFDHLIGDFAPSSPEFNDSRVGRLMYDLLMLSPSFEYARTTIKKRAIIDHTRYIPCDGDVVIEINSELMGNGPSSETYKSWWKEIGRYIFDKVPKENTEVVELYKSTHQQAVNLSDYLGKTDEYLKGKHTEDGNPGLIMLAVPLMGSKKNILKSFERLILATEFEKMDDKTKIRLYGQRLNEEAILKKFRLLVMSAISSKRTNLINLSIESGISKKYCNYEKYAEARENKTPQQIDKIDSSITSSTSRALYDMVYIIENAARGRFPCSDKKYLPGIDTKKVLKIIQNNIGTLYKSYSKYEEEIKQKLR